MAICHNKRVIIPGTEDMVKEYKSPVHHIKGAIIGTLIGLIVSTLSSGIIALFNFFASKSTSQTPERTVKHDKNRRRT